MTNSGMFKQHAEHIRRTFFPQWDRKRRWRVVQADDLDGAQGRCDPDTRTISILSGVAGDNLTALLIHEICHAVSNVCHGRLWLQRMEDAANHADQIGLATVAGLLREEIAGYQDDFRVTAAMMYGEISDAVQGNATVTFYQVLDFVRRQYGLTRAQFLKRFRRAKTVFAEVKRDAKERAKAKRLAVSKKAIFKAEGVGK